MKVALEVKGLVVNYSPALWWRRKPGKPTLKDINLSIAQAEAVGIVGESGCGKSTLARCLVGLVPPSAGTLFLFGKALPARRGKQLCRSIQMVFQDPSSAINPAMTPRQILRELLIVHGLRTRKTVDDRVQELLTLVELPLGLADVLPSKLSGGQKQRLGIARALALEPEVLIADESVAALDVSVQASILSLFRKLRTELSLTLIFISHDLAVVRQVCDRVLVMADGESVEDQSTEALFDSPEHPYTRALLAAVPRLKIPNIGQGSAVGRAPAKHG